MILPYRRKPETIYACLGSEMTKWGLETLTGQKDYRVPTGHWVLRGADGRVFTMPDEGFRALFELATEPKAETTSPDPDWGLRRKPPRKLT